MIVSILQMWILRHRKNGGAFCPVTGKKMKSWVCVVSEPELNHEKRTEKPTPADARSRALHKLPNLGGKARFG